ncbi:hypothetical protein [Xanthomonas arboricola]|uniref:hypothetical protein n=1 Tax=Xanthomonas arboricola TaxID=56448 RepID=UPI0004D8FF05|nr:hypothetical protein [Xanthomonas arboricola]KER79953.1 hypothetical protein IA64_20990 [Xanthomonas arboricola pv. celebensis]
MTPLNVKYGLRAQNAIYLSLRGLEVCAILSAELCKHFFKLLRLGIELQLIGHAREEIKHFSFKAFTDKICDCQDWVGDG